MTKLLEEAIEQLRELPDEDQDAAADAMFAYISCDERHYRLSSDQIADVRRIQSGVRAGTIRLATDSQVDALRRRKRA
jgi:hypothetical protein